MKVSLSKVVVALVFVLTMTAASAQLIDRTLAPNTANEGIALSFQQQIGAGRGDWTTPTSSLYIIHRDPFRSIRRGRQLFQRKFSVAQGLGPRMGDGSGSIDKSLAIGAGVADSCAGCHGRPRGAAGFGGDVATRPDSRDAPHLFGLGLKEMLADEITKDLRAIRAAAASEAQAKNAPVTKELLSKGIKYGSITARADGTFDTSKIEGVNADLRVRPFFAHGGTISIREFVVGALQAEMGLQAVDPDLDKASKGQKVITPAGMVLDGSIDSIEAPPAQSRTEDPDRDHVKNEIPEAAVDHFEFYFLNYFKPAVYKQTSITQQGRALVTQIGCTSCHVADVQLDRDRRVADVETRYDEVNGIFNRLFATATPLFDAVDDGSGHPTVKTAKGAPFVVRDIFTDFKRHDVGPAFYERDYDGTTRTQFLTTPLWGVGSTAPYGHDGRSMNLYEVIMRHGGEAQDSRDRFAGLSEFNQAAIVEFLNSLIIFPPDDTASNLDPGNRGAAGFPQFGHGSVKLGALFNDPGSPE